MEGSNLDPRHGRVCLAIATFRNDDSVADLLEDVYATGTSPFYKVIVYDSLGTGTIDELIAQRGWTGIEYHNADRNLGSAGNLAARLDCAACTDADYVYTINHDGHVDVDIIAELVDQADRIDNVGAAYPLHFYENRDAFDQTGTSSLPLPFRPRDGAPTDEVTDVTWSSSNGALYALEPVRQGLRPDPDLWMGWEDMGYGWQLDAHGYRQILVNDAVFADDYEYKRYDLLGRPVYITEKPAWYTYYQIRNLFLIADHNNRAAATYATIASRIAIELGLTTAFRPDKITRYRYLAAGLLDGLRKKRGKWKVP